MGRIRAIRGLWNDPWCIRGDFNVVRFPQERSGGTRRLSATMRRFSKAIDELQLRDLHLIRGPFMWREGLNNQVLARLDRFLVSDD